MGNFLGSSMSFGSVFQKTGFTGAANIGDQFVLGYSLYPTTSGGSSWALSENPVNLAGTGFFWGASVSIPAVNEAVQLDKSGTNTAAIIAASLDGNAAQAARLYSQNNYTGYALPSYEGAQKMEIGLVPAVGSIFTPYDGISFWTSTEKDNLNAYYFTIRDGLPWLFGYDLKTVQKPVWPIIRFNYQA